MSEVFYKNAHHIRVIWTMPDGQQFDQNTILSAGEFERLAATKPPFFPDGPRNVPDMMELSMKRDMRDRWCKMMGERMAYLFSVCFDRHNA